ncbi:MAG: tRNA (adenosine(37)-N6)-threonylcarbamoyltransferase complex dimerization subunit type 1 TsaB [Pseudomonadota bacterium]
MSAPLVLGFDTSGAYCAAALVHGKDVLAAVGEEMARGQAERLIGLLEEVLEGAGRHWSDLDALGVGVGPGNFTGIRIAVSAARGLALGLDIPAVGVSLFDTTQRLSKWAQTAVPAPRDQVYFLDPDKDRTPVLRPRQRLGTTALSTEHSPAEHARAIARIAAERAGPDTPAPKPLYVKTPDAAPARDAPPTILT